MTSLMYAAKNGYTHMVRMLLLITSDDLLMTSGFQHQVRGAVRQQIRV